MLTRMFSVMSFDSRSLMGGAVALTLLLALLGVPVTFDRAKGGGVSVSNCVGSPTSVSCVRRWEWTGHPDLRGGPPNEQEVAESAERQRQWEARCHPLIKQDQYGVGHYYYAAPGCEFGKFQD